MSRKLFLIVGLTALSISPAIADVIEVTVDGSVSGSGTATTDCGLLSPEPPECVPSPGGPPVDAVSYSFASTNTQLGTFSDSGSATGVNGSAEGQASQDVTAMSDSIGITLSASHTIQGAVLYYSGTESDSVTVDFDLTSLSEASLSGSGFIEPGMFAPAAGELLDSNGNVILTVPNSPAGVTVLLQPGLYELSTGAQVFPTGGGPSGGGTFTDLQLDFGGTFTPVPEPRGALFAVLFFGLLVARFVSRRRAV